MDPDRRSLLSWTFETSARLGLYLEPATEDNVGAVLRRFEPVDGSPGLAEVGGVLFPGLIIVSINDTSVAHASFPHTVALLVNAPRPCRTTWRDPEVPSFRDRNGFLRSKLSAEREREYNKANAEAAERSDRAWVAFLSSLGGPSRGVAGGVARLLRDARGEVVFPLEPSVNLNAVSPLRARMSALSSSSASSATTLGGGGEGAASPPVRPSEEGVEPPPASVISIYQRCWVPGAGSVGVSVPPGLDVSLPGELPRPAERAKLTATLHGLVLGGGIPAAYRGALWWQLSGGHAKQALHPPGYYNALVTQLKPAAEAAYAIGKDVDRTFPGHTFFDTASGQASLSRVLCAFATHHPAIGYCQSLNFLAGWLLLQLPSEEAAFWTLEVLVNEILPPECVGGSGGSGVGPSVSLFLTPFPLPIQLLHAFFARCAR